MLIFYCIETPFPSQKIPTVSEFRQLQKERYKGRCYTYWPGNHILRFKLTTIPYAFTEADDRAIKLAHEANEDYVDTEAYRKENQAVATGSPVAPATAVPGQVQPNQTGDGDYARGSRTGDAPARPIVGGPPKEAERSAQQGQDVDDLEGDLNTIPREDGPKSGKEEKEEAMKKAQTAGQKSNKIEYKG